MKAKATAPDAIVRPEAAPDDGVEVEEPDCEACATWYPKLVATV